MKTSTIVIGVAIVAAIAGGIYYSGKSKNIAPTQDNIKVETKDDTKVNPVKSTGTLTGHVTVGPICPVERVDEPCPVPPAAYTARQVGVFSQATASTPEGSTNSKLIASKHLDAQGNYQFSLAPGTYTVKASGMRVDNMDTVVGTVTIKAGEITTLNFDIDTGIR